MSFYKEELSGETANYVHIRATTDEMNPVDTLRLLAEETLACEEKIRLFIGEDHELMAIWRSLEQVRTRTTCLTRGEDALTKIFKGFLSFHMKTPRYRLADLRLSEED